MAVTWFVSPHLAHLPIDWRVRRLTTVHLPSGATVAFGDRSWFVAFDTCRCCCWCWRLCCFGGCSVRDRFNSNLPTPLSDRCSPSLWKAASSAAPFRNVKFASLSMNLTSTSLHASFTFMLTSARLSGLARRFDGSTLLTVMVGVTVFAFRSSCAMFSFIFAALTSLVVSCVPPTMNISSMVSVFNKI